MRNVKEVFSDRTCYKFLNKPVELSLLKEVYDMAKLGPTSGNSCPLRIVFVQTIEEKEKLYKCLAETNIAKVKTAPVTAIFAYDSKFYELMPKLFPNNASMQNYFSSSEKIVFDTSFRNSTLQAAYFMIAARSVGLSCGPMSGFNEEAVNNSFFSNSSYKVNFICNLGYRDGENEFARLPRLDFEEVAKII